MKPQIPDFPYHDPEMKVMALLGYTGVGKTSLITAGYFANIMRGKDDFTQRFFQRIEDEIRESGGIPLTLGEASTLNFIEGVSRSEFTVQDFSGEHIKLERKEKPEYQKLITRADSAHALLCLISASNFYRSTQIYEEIDAIQTFINRLRGLGTRIPVAVVLTKCDMVPRFYAHVPIVKSILALISRLPFFRLPPRRGLEKTMRRFPSLFSLFQFQGKGPRVEFMGIAIPRLRKLRPWQWPSGFQWLAKMVRRLFLEPQWLFETSYQLEKPFQFCYQAFQVSMLRDFLVRYHDSPDLCKEILAQFKAEVIEKKPYGDFYFQDYFDRILEDTKSLIEEMQVETQNLRQSASQLLSHEKDLGEHLRLWQEKMGESLAKFHKPWSQGVRQSLEALRRDTLVSVKDQLQAWLDKTREDASPHAFYRMIDLLRLRREMEKESIWQSLSIALPDVSIFSKKLFDHFLRLTLSRSEVSLSLFEEDKNKYLDVLTVSLPQEMIVLERLMQAASLFQRNVAEQEATSGPWPEKVLAAFQNLDREWTELAKKEEITPESPWRESREKLLLASLKKEGAKFQSLSQILEWAAQAQELVRCASSRQTLGEIQNLVIQQSQIQLQKEIDELKVRAQKWRGTGKMIPKHLKEWFEQGEKKRSVLFAIAGNKGIEALELLQKSVLAEIADFLATRMKALVEKDTAGSFADLSEFLHVYSEIEKTDLFMRRGLSLPRVEEIEKALFQQLFWGVLSRTAITKAVYEEEQTRFLSSLRGSAPTLLSTLEGLVHAFDDLQKGIKAMSSLPTQEWEKRVLTPMQAFHASYLALGGKMPLPSPSALRQEAERMVVTSFQKQIENLKLTEIREWIQMLSPLLQIEENRTLLDAIREKEENQIRGAFHQDLEDFIQRCGELQKAANELQRKQGKEAQARWQHFAGSLRSLEYSAKKFPKTELSFDEKIRTTLSVEAPREAQKALETWIDSLLDKKLLTGRRCEEMLLAMERLRNILERPEAFRSLSEHVEKLKGSLRKKRIRKIYVGLAALVLLALTATFFYGRFLVAQQMWAIETWAKHPQAKHVEIAQAWEELLSWPRWIFPSQKDFDRATDQMVMERHLANLDSLLASLNERNLDEKALVTMQKNIEILGTNQHPMVLSVAQRVLLEIQGYRLWLRLSEKNADKNTMQKEWEALQQKENELKKENPLYHSPILEDVRKKIQEN